jgi:hypothetical protein
VTEPNKTHDNDKTDTAKLREMTGAPDIHQPLVSKDAFADIEVSSERPVWKLPLPKLALIAVALVPVFGLAGFFFMGNRGTQQQAEILEEPPEAVNSAETEGETNNLQQAEQEIATLKSRMALSDQAYIRQSSQPTKASAAPSRENKSDDAIATLPPRARAVNATVQTSPPPISYRPSPPAVQTSSSVMSRAEPAISSNPTSLESVDPFEHWRQLAQVGSYGSISPASVTNESPETELAADESFPASKPTTVPAAYFASTSAIVPTSKSAIFQEEPVESLSKDGPPKPAILEDATETSPKAEEPTVLSDAEARILGEPFADDQGLSETAQMRSLIAGSHVSGELATPIILDNEGVEDRFVVVLADPLMDSSDKVAIPAGSLLAVQVDRTSEDGLVQLSATQAIWEEDGLQRELVLPNRTILVRGDGGNPLMAESYGDSGGDIAAMDVGQFALGAIRRVGELYTRSDSRVQTGDGATVITESNPAPNILAGALEGGTDAILDSITERNQRAIEKLEQRPRVPYIPAGKAVQVFVNQSMQMPTDF